MIQTQPTQPIINFEYSAKQMQYIHEALHNDPYEDHRHNIKSGATQCGKTTVDNRMVIPFRITVRKGLDGLIGIGGVSLGTIERNVLDPMREYFAKINLPYVVGNKTRKDATGNTFIEILGEKVYMLGMSDKTAISRMRGAKFKYFYCDESAEYNEEAFELLKSRLSLEYSTCDYSCNPVDENHFFYKFIKSGADIYLQEYTIFDNPFLSKKYVDNLCKEYAGTVWYQRYILGKWVQAEGVVFKPFANNPKEFIINEIPKLMKINVGIDFGGNGSWHVFHATGVGLGYKYAVHLETKKIEGLITPNQLEEEFSKFIKMVWAKYNSYSNAKILYVYCDSAEQVLIKGLKTKAIVDKLPITINNARKMSVKERIKLQLRMFGLKMLYVMAWDTEMIQAYQKAVYNSDSKHSDERLDTPETNRDGTIDKLDACEYSLEPDYKEYMFILGGTNGITRGNTTSGSIN